MEASSSRGGGQRLAGASGAPVHSLGTDLLCAIFALLDHFDLVRCSAVCKSWNRIIYTSCLMRDLYYKRNPHVSSSNVSVPSETLMKKYLEDLAMDEHRSAFLSGSTEVHQWDGHRVRANICRMKRGSILTGVGDKVLRLWSAESCKYVDEYCAPDMSPLVDFNFDENKIVGLTSSQLCIWRRDGKKGIFQSRQGIFTRCLCMSYVDPEVVIGCEDGRTHVFDMYSRSCSRIIRLQSGPVTCLTITDDQLIVGGSSFGTIAVADLTSGERLAFLKSSFAPTGMKTLSFNMNSLLLFAGSTSGYAHCWDFRQNTGEVLASFVVDPGKSATISSEARKRTVEKTRVRSLGGDIRVDSIPRYLRPPITCLSVGMKKIVTTHNENFIRLWRFREKL
ncbi:F-box/WD-40 repeat-containing protein At3g52030-like isoform X2 [Typha angustifolia]|uniref:F-box/WD-40 repeat-containing protein At3g52030-like isoform X2 n=1 Tax=Typha angustifolia TaxID=59011 RepID=UPI003C2F059C